MKEKLLAAGGIAGALAASACCIAPLALVTAGVGGAWIGALTALAPYQPLFLAFAVASLGAGFWMAYRPAARTREDAACAVPGRSRILVGLLGVKGVLWIGAALVALSVGVDYGTRWAL